MRTDAITPAYLREVRRTRARRNRTTVLKAAVATTFLAIGAFLTLAAIGYLAQG